MDEPWQQVGQCFPRSSLSNGDQVLAAHQHGPSLGLKRDHDQSRNRRKARQREDAEAMRPYLDGGGLVKTDSLDIFHDLWITPKGLQESTARFGNGPLLAFLLQVIHKDIVILFSLWGGNTHTHTHK